MKIGSLSAAWSAQPLEEVLDFFARAGLQAVEIGAGAYPGSAHCDAVALNKDAKARKAFLKAIESRGLVLSALSVHGNPLHPCEENAGEHRAALLEAVKLASSIGVKCVSGFSTPPGGCATDKAPNWTAERRSCDASPWTFQVVDSSTSREAPAQFLGSQTIRCEGRGWALERVLQLPYWEFAELDLRCGRVKKERIGRRSGDGLGGATGAKRPPSAGAVAHSTLETTNVRKSTPPHDADEQPRGSVAHGREGDATQSSAPAERLIRIGTDDPRARLDELRGRFASTPQSPEKALPRLDDRRQAIYVLSPDELDRSANPGAGQLIYHERAAADDLRALLCAGCAAMGIGGLVDDIGLPGEAGNGAAACLESRAALLAQISLGLIPSNPECWAAGEQVIVDLGKWLLQVAGLPYSFALVVVAQFLCQEMAPAAFRWEPLLDVSLKSRRIIGIRITVL